MLTRGDRACYGNPKKMNKYPNTQTMRLLTAIPEHCRKLKSDPPKISYSKNNNKNIFVQKAKMENNRFRGASKWAETHLGGGRF